MSELLSLSLSDLRKSLEQRGVTMSLSALSEFIKTGDIAELLKVGGRVAVCGKVHLQSM